MFVVTGFWVIMLKNESCRLHHDNFPTGNVLEPGFPKCF